MADELVTIREYTNPWEAEWARDVLASAGICCLLPDASLNYLYNFIGAVRVQVASSVAQEAENILAEQEFSRRLTLGGKAGQELESQDPTEPVSTELTEKTESPVDAIDPRDACPMREPRGCPNCGGEEIESVSAPAHEGQSALAGVVKRFFGHGWKRCSACGHQWEE
jgi:hypothetical protein